MKKLAAFAFRLLCAFGLAGCGRESASVGIIGGADGPTAILVASNMDWLTVFLVLIVAILLVLCIICRNKKKK